MILLAKWVTSVDWKKSLKISVFLDIFGLCTLNALYTIVFVWVQSFTLPREKYQDKSIDTVFSKSACHAFFEAPADKWALGPNGESQTREIRIH